MPYSPFRDPAALQRLVPGVTREDHWLDFRKERHTRPEDCARDIAQFSNASGGALVIGADENDHLFKGWEAVPSPNDYIRWIDDVVKKHLTPVPVVEPIALLVPGEPLTVVVVNVPASLPVISRPVNEGFEFPIRRIDSRSYMTLIEVEDRMQNKERAMKLRIEQIPAGEKIRLDAFAAGVNDRDWIVQNVDDTAVTLANTVQSDIVTLPLAYVEAVYPTPRENNVQWVIAASCTVQGGQQIIVSKYNLPVHMRRY